MMSLGATFSSVVQVRATGRPSSNSPSGCLHAEQMVTVYNILPVSELTAPVFADYIADMDSYIMIADYTAGAYTAIYEIGSEFLSGVLSGCFYLWVEFI